MIDLSRPRMNLSYNVRRLGTTDIGPIRRAADVVLRGHHAYVCLPYEGIYVLDIHDPRHPRMIGTWGWWEEGWSPARLKVIGERAYAVGQTLGQPRTTLALRILDISRPTHPREIGCCYGGSQGGWEPLHWDVAVAGNYAYVAYGGDSLWVVDITNPEAPEGISEILMDQRVSAVDVRDGLACIAANGLLIMDVRDPLDPVVVNHALKRRPPKVPVAFQGFLPEPPMCRQLVVSGDRAYLSNDAGGFFIADVADWLRPERIGKIHPPENVRDVDLAVCGDFAVMLDVGRRGQVRIVDARDAADPVQAGFIDISKPCHCLAAAGDLIYVAGYTHFGVYDASAAMKKNS